MPQVIRTTAQSQWEIGAFLRDDFRALILWSAEGLFKAMLGFCTIEVCAGCTGNVNGRSSIERSKSLNSFYAAQKGNGVALFVEK